MKIYIKFIPVFILSVFIASMIGCRANPIYNVENAAIVANKKTLSKNDVRKAIIRAGSSLGWTVNKTKSGPLIATLNIRQHMAQVEISYDTKSYSIRYKDSTNLNYDGINIHKKYRLWIQNLDRAINVQLSALRDRAFTQTRKKHR